MKKPSAEFLRFDEVVKRILMVPRAEIKEREKGWMCKKKLANKKRAISRPASLGLAAERPLSG